MYLNYMCTLAFELIYKTKKKKKKSTLFKNLDKSLYHFEFFDVFSFKFEMTVFTDSY